MPDIEMHGFHGALSSPDRLRKLLNVTPYAKDLTFTDMHTDVRLISKETDAFLRIYASAGWLGKYKDDILSRLTPHYGVEIVPIEWHPKAEKVHSAGGGPVTAL